MRQIRHLKPGGITVNTLVAQTLVYISYTHVLLAVFIVYMYICCKKKLGWVFL